MMTGQAVPMALGKRKFIALRFSLGDVQRRLETRWAEVNVAGREASLHWTGPKRETVTIKGVLFPAAFGGPKTLALLRADAQNGRPLRLVTADGVIGGVYAIQSISEDQAIIDARGMPHKLSYTIELMRVGR